MAGKRPNGEDSLYPYRGGWCVQGFVNGHRSKRSGRTQAEARKNWAAFKAEAAKSGPRRGGPRTVAELLEDWLAMKAPHLAYKTSVTYRRSIDAHLVPRFGKQRLTDLTIGDVERWQMEMLKMGLAPSTVRQGRSALSQAMDMAVRHGDLVVNPVRQALNVKKRTPRMDSLSLDEARILLQSIPAASVQDQARVLLAVTLGLRQGEILALRWDSLDLEADRPTLRVDASLQRQTGKGLILVEPKTERSKRTLYLAPEHVAALQSVRNEQRRMTWFWGPDGNPDGYVFTSTEGTAVDPANDRKRWFRLLDEAGVRRVKVHASRHTAATLMLSQNLGMASVQQVLGHTSIRTTVDIYGHLTAESGAEAVAAVTSSICA